MKVLLKTMPRSFKLKIDEIFTSKTNKKIMNDLIAELLRLMAPRFNPTQKQLWSWFGALHRHQRGRFLQQQSGRLTDDNRRIHVNSRVNEVWFFFFFAEILTFRIFTEFYRKKREELKVPSYFLSVKQNDLRNIIKMNCL